jgi:myo-inositol 2-dehydrogenase / D-chiro-inositol 1-dehydrogenase
MIKVGVIGLGHMGQLHMQNIMRIKGVEVVAGADKASKNRKYAERFHVKTYDDYTKLIDSEELEAVIISLPNFLKKEGVFYAAEKGLDIFLDKPIARNLIEAKDMVRKVEKQDVRMMVGVNYRYFPCVEKLKNKIDNGGIGDPLIATSELVLNGPISHALVPVPVPEWWLNKDLAGGGALLDLGYHLIDLLGWMLGDFNVAYSNLGHQLHLPVEDDGTIILQSKNRESKAIVNVGWFSKTIFPDFNFRLTMHGTVGFDSTDRYLPANPVFNAIKEGALNLARKIVMKKLNYLAYTYYYASFYKIMEAFFESLKSGSDFPIDLDSQLNTMQIIDSSYRQNNTSSLEKQFDVTQIVDSGYHLTEAK